MRLCPFLKHSLQQHILLLALDVSTTAPAQCFWCKSCATCGCAGFAIPCQVLRAKRGKHAIAASQSCPCKCIIRGTVPVLQDWYIGICSQAANGRYLQARKRGGPQRLCFFSIYWGIWEQWKVRAWSAASTSHALIPAPWDISHHGRTAEPVHLLTALCILVLWKSIALLGTSHAPLSFIGTAK